MRDQSDGEKPASEKTTPDTTDIPSDSSSGETTATPAASPQDAETARQTSEDEGAKSLSRTSTTLELGAQLYDWRHYTPAVLALLTLMFCNPTAKSATIGTLLVVCGEILRLYSAAFLGPESWSSSPAPSATTFVRQGPYALIRHPLYAGNYLILVGFAVYSGALWLTCLAALAFAFQYHCIGVYEDSLLEETFGEAFGDYQKTVPAWIPARPLSLAELDWPASLGDAIAAEKRMFLALGLMFVALIFLA